MTRFAASFAAVSILVAPAATQTLTWYVDQSAPPGGDGSQAAPFQRINDAGAIAGPADWIRVAPGVYPEQVVTAASTLEGIGGPDLTTIQAIADGPVVTCTNQAYFDLRGISVLGSPDYDTVGISSLPPLSCTVRSCVIRGHERALDSTAGSTVLLQSTVADNDMVYQEQNIADIFYATNSILSGGPPTFGTRFVTNSILDLDGVPGVDPRFWNPPTDLHLRPDSPAIVPGAAPDIGALPYDPTYIPEPVRFCTAKVSSAGCLPSIGFGGGPASFSSPNPFLVRANGVDELKNGHLFFGLAPGPFPFLGGWHCMVPPTKRTPLARRWSSPARWSRRSTGTVTRTTRSAAC